MADDPRTVTVSNVDGRQEKVTPEAANAIHGHNGWTRDDDPDSIEARIADAVDQATAPLLARIAELETQAPPAGNPADMPENAADVIAWIGTDADRARTAADAEAQRPSPRKTVTDHIESVINTPPPAGNPADHGQGA